MKTTLFGAPVFGPVNSRRLGVSLGINLLPTDGKLCSFNCLYCECGLNEERKPSSTALLSPELVKEEVEKRLQAMRSKGEPLNVITFAGNGEPTLHPDFKQIIDDTIALRNAYYPKVKIAVLTNAAHLSKPSVFEALKKVDNNILKLDTAIESTFRLLNAAAPSISLNELILHQSQFEKGAIIQTLFCKGETKGKAFDNTSQEEIEALLRAYKTIDPERIMVYSLSRNTPIETICKIEQEELENIAQKLRAHGLKVDVS